jgi:hypothetical protein
MRTRTVKLPTEVIPAEYFSDFRPGLNLMLRTLATAVREKADIRDMAVSYERLRRGELTDDDVRCLLQRGAIAPTEMSIERASNGFAFLDDDLLTVPPRARFFLTPAGFNCILRFFAADGRPLRFSLGKPYLSFDGPVRALFYAGFLVKRIPRHASTQGIIIHALNDASWPIRIDRPLAKAPGKDSAKLLNDAIRNFNATRVWKVVEFHGDGTGHGIQWRSLLGAEKDLR